MSVRTAIIAALLFAPVATAQESIRQHFEAGRKYQSAGEVTLAESEYRQALGMALTELGALLAARKDFDGALKAYREAAEASATSDEPLIGQAIVHMLQRDADPGIEAIGKVLLRNPSNLRARHVLGKLLMVAGRFREAVSELEVVVAQNPADLGAAYTLALVYLEDKRFDPAKKILDGLVESLGDSPELRVLMGRAYQEMDFLDPAVEEFRKAIALNPKARRAHFLLGQTWLQREGSIRLEEALGLFRQELEINPNDFQTLLLAGIAYREDRRFEEAVEVLTRAVEIEPGSADAHHYLGISLHNVGRHGPAVQALEKAIALTTDVSRSHYQVSNSYYVLSQALRRLGNEEAARKALAKAEELKTESATTSVDSLDAFLRADSDASHSALSSEGKDLPGALTLEIDLPRTIDPEAQGAESGLTRTTAAIYNALALVRASQGDFRRAAELFRRAGSWDAELRDLRYNLALTYFNMKAWAEAAPLLEEELIAKPGNAAVRHMAALSWFYLAEFDKAIPALREVLKSRPGDAEVRVALAISLMRTGESAEGEKLVRELLQGNPGQPSLHLLMGQVLAQQGFYAPAADAFREALRLAPELPEAHYYLGMALLRGGRFDAAEEAFRSELRIRPRDPRAHYHIGYLMLMKHQVDEGLAEMRTAIEIDPSYTEAHYQLGKSYLQQGKLEEARQSLETAAGLDPGKDYVHYQLSLAYSRLGLAEEAAAEMETYRRLKSMQRHTSPMGSEPHGGVPPP